MVFPAPPSYEQCMTDDTVSRVRGSEDENNGPPEYYPKYPVFKYL
jgi:hypothetical protein